MLRRAEQQTTQFPPFLVQIQHSVSRVQRWAMLLKKITCPGRDDLTYKYTHTHTHIYKNTHKRVQQRCLGDVCGVWKAAIWQFLSGLLLLIRGPRRNLCPIGYMINLWANYHSASSEASFLNYGAVSLVECQSLIRLSLFTVSFQK